MISNKIIVIFLCSMGFGAIAHAEVEIEDDLTIFDEESPFKKPSGILDQSLFNGQFARDVDHDVTDPLPLPKFVNPFTDDIDSDIKQKVTVLDAFSSGLHVARDIHIEASLQPLGEGVAGVEIILPANRCELGTIRWGSVADGFNDCKVLGRGETVFGSLKLLAGLRATQPQYRTWVLGELPAALPAAAIKKREHFGTEPEYTHCMYRPETESNGASITTRPNSTIGHYVLDTGRSIHPGKEKWGRNLITDKLLLPVRMNKVESVDNKKYADQGVLIRRYDFWLHSYENSKDEMPLEAHSTWGCPRVPRSCMAEIQNWVADQNDRGRKPKLIVRQEEIMYPVH